MRVVAAIVADLDVSPIGTRSRLLEMLAGESVLRRTVLRTMHVEGIASVHVLVPSPQFDKVAELLKDLPAGVHRADWPVAPHQALVQLTRKWALDNWRGGISGACSFDESFHPAGLRALVEAVHADGVMVVPAHAALLNSHLSQRMLAHFNEHGSQYRMTFAQSPPGLTPVFATSGLLAELEQGGYPPGMILAYNPAAPEPDLIGKPLCYQVPTGVACTAGRLLADTAASFDLCRTVIESLGEELTTDAMATCRFLAEYRRGHLANLPAEVEIELTTEDSLPGTVLRPRGRVVPGRGPMELGLLKKVLSELNQRDDARVVFGGFGDPLCHAQWQEAVRLVRRAGIFGLSIHTTGKRLAQIGAEAILADPPDMLVAWLDAASDDVYAAMQNEAGYEQAAAAVQAIENSRRQRRQVQPLLVPAITKAVSTLRDLEAFVDLWIRQVGSCWVEGYSSRAGQCERLQVASMAPPGRIPCRRLRSRMMVLADGRVASCDQDFKGLQIVGDLRRQSVAEIWQGEVVQQLREFVPAAAKQSALLCERCEEWDRP